MSYLQTKLDYADVIAEWFLELGETSSQRGEFDEAMKSTYVAANILCRQNRVLSSARLESNLRSIADRVSECNGSQGPAHRKAGQTEVCLHVMSEALPAGGITSMVTRWIRNDRSGRVQSLILLESELPIPDDLLLAVRERGGSIYTANPEDSMLQKATWLRALAKDIADYVVLHVGVSDVICGAAFGAKGGPPVLLVNYTAHAFWAGACIADLVVNVRGSPLEELWTRTYRGISRYATIPIALSEPTPEFLGASSDSESKRQAKEALGLPAGSVVILTVGASFKFLPKDNLDFAEVCASILEKIPEAHLLVVGFLADNRWRNASRRLQSRIRTLGTVRQSSLAKVHEASDIYIEGFPFGTTTALLEAGLKGIPAVLAPAECPPPYGSDGVALDDTLERPATVNEYKNKVLHLAANSTDRQSEGRKLRGAILKYNTGLGWNRYLESALGRLPSEHLPQPLVKPVPTPEVSNEYWCAFIDRISSGYEETLELAVSRAFSLGLRPAITRPVRQACREYRAVRAHRTIPLPLVTFLCNILAPILPTSLIHHIFRAVAFVYRPALLARTSSKISSFLGITSLPGGMYEEYREKTGSKGLRLNKSTITENRVD